MASGELLLEVRCEEIPARMLQPAIRELASRLFEELMPLNLAPKEVRTCCTPRRLVLIVKGLPQKEPDREEELIGPPVSVAYGKADEPTPAALGFAKKCGVAPSELRRIEKDKGEYLAATRRIAGRPTAIVLAELLPPLIRRLSWAKSMRWGAGEGPWVRPVHGLVAIFDGAVVPFELFGVGSSDTTIGHPVHSGRPFKVSGGSDYLRKMARRGIEVRFEARRQKLLDRMTALAKEAGGELVQDDELLDRLTAICGSPGIVHGQFDPAYLTLPREVLVTSLRHHQSAFTLESNGDLLPSFLTVMDRLDDPAGRVQAGNEWVVEARLADARFFYDEDRKRTLSERQGDLENLSFHARLGSYGEKARRIGQLSEVLCSALGWEDDLQSAKRAAELLKVDLTTQMVKEFTSLQGIMGGVYAREEGEPEEVWQAIYEQYQPASSNDRIPKGRVARITGLADRIDTLVGIFGLGLVPTGSRDPFGLRRAAQGVVRVVLEGGLPLDLDLVAARAVLLYDDRLEKSGDEILATLRPFLHDRVRHILGQQGHAYDSIEAALAVSSRHLPDLKARVEALQSVRDEPSFLSVVLAAKRIANIIKDSPEYDLDEDLLTEQAERDLHREAQELRTVVETAEAAGEYERCFRRIADLAEVLDRFFIEVLVMDENRELRFNRIALLQSIQRTLSRTARLTEVVVDRAEHRKRGEEGRPSADPRERSDHRAERRAEERARER